MEYRLDRIAVLKLATFSGVAYAIMTAIFIVPFSLVMIGGGAASEELGGAETAFGGVFMMFLPVAYGIFGFVGGAIGALVYNLLAKMLGGLEFTLSPTTPSVATPPMPAAPRAPDGPFS